MVIVVDDLGSERRQPRKHVRCEAVHEECRDPAAIRICDEFQLVAEPVGRRHIPQQVVHRRGMSETSKGSIKLCQIPGHGAPLRGRPAGLAGLQTVNISQHPQGAARAVRQPHRFACPPC